MMIHGGDGNVRCMKTSQIDDHLRLCIDYDIFLADNQLFYSLYA